MTVEDTLDGNYLDFDVVPSDIDHVELSFEVPSAPDRKLTLNWMATIYLLVISWIGRNSIFNSRIIFNGLTSISITTLRI